MQDESYWILWLKIVFCVFIIRLHTSLVRMKWVWTQWADLTQSTLTHFNKSMKTQGQPELSRGRSMLPLEDLKLQVGCRKSQLHQGFQMFHKSTLEIHGNENAYIDNYDNYIIIGFFYDKDKLNSIYPSYTVSRLLWIIITGWQANHQRTWATFGY